MSSSRPASCGPDPTADSRQAFHEAWFAAWPVTVAGAAGRPHSPTSAPLSAGDFPGAVRWSGQGLLERSTTEGTWLEVPHGDGPACASWSSVTRAPSSVSPTWGPHPIWPRICLLAVWCHPAFWDHGAELAGALDLPAAQRCVAFSAGACPRRADVLAALGFASVGSFPGRVTIDTEGRIGADVTEWERG